MYRIVCLSAGGTRTSFMDGLTERDAIEICEGYGWSIQIGGSGYVWDLEIEESIY